MRDFCDRTSAQGANHERELFDCWTCWIREEGRCCCLLVRSARSFHATQQDVDGLFARFGCSAGTIARSSCSQVDRLRMTSPTSTSSGSHSRRGRIGRKAAKHWIMRLACVPLACSGAVNILLAAPFAYLDGNASGTLTIVDIASENNVASISSYMPFAVIGLNADKTQHYVAGLDLASYLPLTLQEFTRNLDKSVELRQGSGRLRDSSAFHRFPHHRMRMPSRNYGPVTVTFANRAG